MNGRLRGSEVKGQGQGHKRPKLCLVACWIHHCRSLALSSVKKFELFDVE